MAGHHSASQKTSLVPCSYVCSAAHPFDEALMVHFFLCHETEVDRKALNRYIGVCEPVTSHRNLDTAALSRARWHTTDLLVQQKLQAIAEIARINSLAFSPVDIGFLFSPMTAAMKSISTFEPVDLMDMLSSFICCADPPFYWAESVGKPCSNTLTCDLVHAFQYAASPRTGALAMQRDRVVALIQSNVKVAADKLHPPKKSNAKLRKSFAGVGSAASMSGGASEDDYNTPPASGPSSRRNSLGSASGAAVVATGPFEVDNDSAVLRAVQWWWRILRSAPLPQHTKFPKVLLESYEQRLQQFRLMERMRGYCLRVDTSAGAAAVDSLQSSEVLTVLGTWLRERLNHAIGYVGDLIGAAMTFKPNWFQEPRCSLGKQMRKIHFALAPDITLLDGGSSPALPIPIHRARKEWERCVQVDPVLFRFKSLVPRLRRAASKVGKKLVAAAGDVMFLSSKQHALATVFRSLPWVPGDKALVIECGGLLYSLLTHICKAFGVEVVVAHINNFATDDEIVMKFTEVISREKPTLCVIPHVTELGKVLPVETLCRECTEYEVLAMVDGSDAIGNLYVNIASVAADFYVATLDNFCFCVPGTSLLVTKVSRHEAISTLTVSYNYGKGYQDEWLYTGLTDISPFISAMHGFQFQKYLCDGFRGYCRSLAVDAQAYLCELWGVIPLFNRPPIHAICCVMLPRSDGRTAADALHTRLVLARNWKIYVGVVVVKMKSGVVLAVRLTCQVYNDMDDIRKLGIAVLQMNGKYSVH